MGKFGPKLVAIAISLEWLQTEWTFNELFLMSTTPENLVKICPVDSAITYLEVEK